MTTELALTAGPSAGIIDCCLLTLEMASIQRQPCHTATNVTKQIKRRRDVTHLAVWHSDAAAHMTRTTPKQIDAFLNRSSQFLTQISVRMGYN